MPLPLSVELLVWLLVVAVVPRLVAIAMSVFSTVAVWVTRVLAMILLLYFFLL